jgi:hypothetical protein
MTTGGGFGMRCAPCPSLAGFAGGAALPCAAPGADAKSLKAASTAIAQTLLTQFITILFTRLIFSFGFQFSDASIERRINPS